MLVISVFEKEELFDPNNIAALIDKSKEESAEVLKTNDDITQDQERNVQVRYARKLLVITCLSWSMNFIGKEVFL